MLVKNHAPFGNADYPPFPELVPHEVLSHGRYQVRFAQRRQELDEILRLRFRVFNLELGEGLAESHRTGRDEDRFDRCCHHLLVEDRRQGRVVGTYRMQTAEMARAGAGFYSAGEFTVDTLPREVLRDAVEVGRTCIAREHRSRHVLFLLWRGLASYVAAQRKRYLFGCCSLSSQDPRDGLSLLESLHEAGRMHPVLRLSPLPGKECAAPEDPRPRSPVIMPTLFRTYLRYGGMVCGPPAMDRAFKTIDFFVLFDVEGLDARRRVLFFGD